MILLSAYADDVCVLVRSQDKELEQYEGRGVAWALLKRSRGLNYER